jgi:hypothetical protein
MEDAPKPDHTDDPREQDTGSGGYPETNPAGTDDDSAAGRPGNGGGGDTNSEAPSPSTDKEADRAASTGNPGAAG